MIEINTIEFNLLKDYLYRISGIEVPHNKRYLFNTRLAKFLEDEGYRSFSEFYNRLITAKDIILQRHLVQAMTTHESGFFRDMHPFIVFEKILLPEISARRIADAKYLAPRLRILSAGCSLGQEPYSIAIYVRKWLETQETFTKDAITILATDLSERVIKRAQKGVYTDKEIGNNLSDNFRRCYFTKRKNHWEVNDDIKNMVRFMELNLSEPFEQIGRFDIIFCRNVIIYFPMELKRNILKQFYTLLNNGGALIMGASESVYNLSYDFLVKQDYNSTYYIPKK